MRLALLSLLAGCHVTSSALEDQQGRKDLRPRPETAVVKGQELTLLPDGRLRIGDRLICTADVMAEVSRYETVTREPNLATAIVGVIAASVGLVAMVIGLSDEDPGGSPATWLGGTGVVVGLPLVIGPLRGNGSEHNLLSTGTTAVGTRNAPCGTRPVNGGAGELKVGAAWVAAAVDSEGVLTVSPFDLIDVFALHRTTTVDIEARIEPERRASAAFSPEDLARARAGFLQAAGIDPRTAPLSKVPGLRADEVEINLTEIGGHPAAEIAVTIGNDGPGPAYQVRGLLLSSYPQLDGRLVYVGALAAGAEASGRVVVPLASPDLDLGQARLRIQLRDANETAPATPLRLKRPR